VVKIKRDVHCINKNPPSVRRWRVLFILPKEHHFSNALKTSYTQDILYMLFINVLVKYFLPERFSCGKRIRYE